MNQGLPFRIFGALGVVMALTAATPPEAPVADAAMTGNLEAVRGLLRQGADVNAAQGDGMTALHWAAERVQIEMVEILLYAGGRVDAVTRIGHYTPLHLASKAGSAPVTRRLLEEGANVQAKTFPAGTTPIHLAAASGQTDVLEPLIEYGADVNALEASSGQTPLIFASALNRAATTAQLLEYGAEPGLSTTVVNLQEQGELDRAANQRQNEVLDAIREASGFVTPSQLQAAVRAGREVLVNGLPEEEEEEEEEEDNRRGGSPNITATGGMTALLHAARQGHLEVARVLLDGGADVDQVSLSDATSPLLMATINGQFDMALMLLGAGANPNLASNIHGVAPLWSVVNSEWQPRTRFPQPQEHHLQNATYMEVLEALLQDGAEPDARTAMHPWYMVYGGCGNRNCGLVDTKGSTAFWRAAYGADVEAMRLLAKYGADPNIPTIAPEQRQRRPRDTGARSARNQISDDSNFNPLSAEERVEALTSVRNELPEVEQAEFLDEELAEISDDRRQELVDRVERADSVREANADPSGLPPYVDGGAGIFPINAAAGAGYGEGFAGNAHRAMPGGWIPSVRYLIEELGADVNQPDHNGYRPLHNAAGRGDNEMILYLISQGGDVSVVNRRGQTTADLANGPVSRIPPHLNAVTLLMGLGSKNNNNCVSC
ncbi:MAG: ankyrin repeat domain-containing protein [bacterium]